MKKRFNAVIDWFEEKFNVVVDMLALFGAVICFLLAIYVLIMSIIDVDNPMLGVDIVILPGLLCFFGVITLFALRITRHITKK